MLSSPYPQCHANLFYLALVLNPKKSIFNDRVQNGESWIWDSISDECLRVNLSCSDQLVKTRKCQYTYLHINQYIHNIYTYMYMLHIVTLYWWPLYVFSQLYDTQALVTQSNLIILRFSTEMLLLLISWCRRLQSSPFIRATSRRSRPSGGKTLLTWHFVVVVVVVVVAVAVAVVVKRAECRKRYIFFNIFNDMMWTSL